MRNFESKNYYFDLINTAIDYERKAGRYPKSIILSRAAYDKFEKWLLKTGVLNENNLISTLWLKKVAIIRSKAANPKELEIEYHTKESNEEQLFDNFKIFGIENTDFMDKVIKNIRK